MTNIVIGACHEVTLKDGTKIKFQALGNDAKGMKIQLEDETITYFEIIVAGKGIISVVEIDCSELGEDDGKSGNIEATDKPGID